MLVAAFWQLDPFTAEVVREPTLENFKEILDRARLSADHATDGRDGRGCHRRLRDPRVPHRVLHGSRRFAAHAADPRRGGPHSLWASYLVKVYTWRTILAENGVLNWLLEPFGIEGPGYSLVGTWLVFTYLWLPYMILPIYAGLERIPASLLEASADLGARGGRTFVRVVLPLAFPAIVAGSIFTFSLTLGDYITPEVVSSEQFIGNVIYDNIGVANNLPFAAAYRSSHRGDDRVPLRGEAAWSVRKPLMVEGRGTTLVPARLRRLSCWRSSTSRSSIITPLRVQREHHASVADRELDDQVVLGRVPRPGCARRFFCRSRRPRRDARRVSAGDARRACCLAFASSARTHLVPRGIADRAPRHRDRNRAERDHQDVLGPSGSTSASSTIVIGHATFCIVLAYNNGVARLRQTSRSLEEASSDLGADTWQTFRP